MLDLILANGARQWQSAPRNEKALLIRCLQTCKSENANNLTALVVRAKQLFAASGLLCLFQPKNKSVQLTLFVISSFFLPRSLFVLLALTELATRRVAVDVAPFFFFFLAATGTGTHHPRDSSNTAALAQNRRRDALTDVPVTRASGGRLGGFPVHLTCRSRRLDLVPCTAVRVAAVPQIDSAV